MQTKETQKSTALNRMLFLSDTLDKLEDLERGMVIGYAAGLSDQIGNHETGTVRGEKR